MTTGDDSGRKNRATQAFRALNEGEQFARRRIWRRVREGVAEDARARRRRRWAIWSGVAAAATVAAFTPALVAGFRNSSDARQALSDDDIAFQAVMQMLAAQTSTGGSGSTEEFVLYLVTEAQADAH